MVKMPRCNWDGEELRPLMNNCPKCGRARQEALNTSPPPTPPIRTQLKQWLSGLFKKTTTAENK